MLIDLLMPKLGLTMSEGVLLEWKVAPGDRVEKGQVLFVVETDKVATEVEAQAGGIFKEQLVVEGETAAVGIVVGRLAAEDEALIDQNRSGPAPDAQLQEITSVSTPPSMHRAKRIVATPLARRIAQKRGVDIAALTGSGPRGRITRVDVENAPLPIGTSPAALEVSQLERIKPSAIQASMARRLAAVKQGVPHFYLSSEVEISELLVLRSRLNADTERERLTLNHFILAAVGRALCDLPKTNRVWADGEIIAFTQSDVSMAVETEKGLFVPVIRAAGTASLDSIGAQARMLLEKSRSGNLTSKEMEGGAIAVSNAGMHDVTWLTPVRRQGFWDN